MSETKVGQVGSITMIGERNRAIVDEFNAAWVARDLDRAMKVLAQDVAIEFPQSGERFDRDTFRLVHQNFPNGLPKIEVKRTTGRDDLFVIEHHLDYGQGKPWTEVSVLELRDEQIVRLTAYFGENFEIPAWRTKLLAEKK